MLSGVRVLSLAQQLPGPYCTMLLADLGAEIILIEQPGSGDPARHVDPSGAAFGAVNRGKRSITVNLKHPSGLDVGKRLLAAADVIVEGFRPGVMARLGLGHDSVLEQYPRLVYCSISGFGQDGPFRDRPAHDLSYQAMTGVVSSAGGDPTAYHSPIPLADLSSAMFAAVGILAALFRREKTGKGEYIDVSMTDGLTSWMGLSLEPLLNGHGSSPIVNESGYGIFRCRDGKFLSLSIAHEDHFWRALCIEIDRSDLANLSRLERLSRRPELSAALADAIEQCTRDEWTQRLGEASVAAAPVLSPEEVVQDPHLRARSMFPALADGSRHIVGHPLKYKNAAIRCPAPAPGLGEHTEAILFELGHTPEQVAALRASGAI